MFVRNKLVVERIIGVFLIVPLLKNSDKQGEKMLDNQECFDKTKRCWLIRKCFEKYSFEVL